MNKWVRRLAWIAGVIVALVAVGYYPLVAYSPAPSGTFALDIARVRALAESIPGDKPVEIRFEQVMSMGFTEAMLMAGAPWRKTPMPVYSYQLVYPQSTIIVDTAESRAMVKPGFILKAYDDDAYQRMNAAMEQATQIVITHEHVDHIGGIAAHPNLAFMMPRVHLTAEQLANRAGMAPATLPADVLQNYEPLKYEGALPIAPGVVLIKAPGHTPGSQMVYVRLADGREVLFLGDVSWRMRNIEQVRERPLFMTMLIGENRQQVLAQFQALHELAQSQPGIALVPGHDGDVIQELVAAKVLVAGFR